MHSNTCLCLACFPRRSSCIPRVQRWTPRVTRQRLRDTHSDYDATRPHTVPEASLPTNALGLRLQLQLLGVNHWVGYRFESGQCAEDDASIRVNTGYLSAKRRSGRGKRRLELSLISRTRHS